MLLAEPIHLHAQPTLLRDALLAAVADILKNSGGRLSRPSDAGRNWRVTFSDDVNRRRTDLAFTGSEDGGAGLPGGCL